MKIIVIVLVLICVYLFIRLLLVKKAIREMIKDFTEIKKNRECVRHLQLKHSQKDLEHLAYEINEYVSSYFDNIAESKENIREIRGEITNLSHDLRTPLTSILGYLDLLDKEKMSIEEKEILSVIKRRSKGLNDLIEQLYDYTRLENNEYKLNIEKIDLYKIVQEHLLEYYMEFQDKNINFQLVMPKEAKPIWINADYKSMIRILTNLTTNALKYTNGEAKVILKCKKDEVNITYVTTRGELTDYDINHIFDRFYKKDLSRHTSTSSGLGLTITRLFTERMGGKIYAYGDEVFLYIVCNFKIIK